jgi:hypothetical protein
MLLGFEGHGYVGLLPPMPFTLILLVPTPLDAVDPRWVASLGFLITGLVGAVVCVWVDSKLAPGKILVVTDPQTGYEVTWYRRDMLGHLPLRLCAVPYGLMALGGIFLVLVLALGTPVTT